jgi:hypothetical protein
MESEEMRKNRTVRRVDWVVCCGVWGVGGVDGAMWNVESGGLWWPHMSCGVVYVS